MLFRSLQRPPLPKGSTKRKFEAPVPDMEALKAPRVDANGKRKGRAVTIKEDDGSDEGEDGPDDSEFAPGGDADYFEEEDQDGRFL